MPNARKLRTMLRTGGYPDAITRNLPERLAGGLRQLEHRGRVFSFTLVDGAVWCCWVRVQGGGDQPVANERHVFLPAEDLFVDSNDKPSMKRVHLHVPASLVERMDRCVKASPLAGRAALGRRALELYLDARGF